MDCRETDAGPVRMIGVERVFYVSLPEEVVKGIADVKKLAARVLSVCLGFRGEVVLDSNENIGTRFMLYRLRPIDEGPGKIRLRIVVREGRVHQVLLLIGRGHDNAG